MPPLVSPMRGDIVEEVLRAMSCTRRMQNTESDTGYDTRRRWSDGALASVSQTAVYDTCGSASSASPACVGGPRSADRRLTAPARASLLAYRCCSIWSVRTAGASLLSWMPVTHPYTVRSV